MSSGMYSALSGNVAKMEALETFTNNMTNINTFGFKKDRMVFTSYLDSFKQNTYNKGINLVRLQQNFIDFSPGSHQPTGGLFDFAIEGEGFFKVQGEDGEFYTRMGQFQRTDDGELLYAGKYKVLGPEGKPILIPNPDVEIDPEGIISDENGQVGRLPIFEVEDLKLLRKRGGGMFMMPDGYRDKVMERPQITRGSLETSNVNLMQEMALMMDSLRAFEAYQKVMKSYSKIGDKGNEIGSL